MWWQNMLIKGKPRNHSNNNPSSFCLQPYHDGHPIVLRLEVYQTSLRFGMLTKSRREISFGKCRKILNVDWIRKERNEKLEQGRNKSMTHFWLGQRQVVTSTTYHWHQHQGTVWITNTMRHKQIKTAATLKQSNTVHSALTNPNFFFISIRMGK